MKPHADTPLTRLSRWQSGETPGPWTITLIPTNRCNLHCSMCWQRAHEVDPAQEIPDARLETLVDEAAALGVRAWNISGGGEPMARADLVLRLCERIRRHGMDGVLQTNATMFTRERIETLIAAQWGRLVVSLDGPTAEINDAIRSEGSFEKATAAVRLLNVLKRERGSVLPEVILHAVLTRKNVDRLDAMVELARDLGCGFIEVSSLTGGAAACEGLRVGPESAAVLSEQVRRATERARDLRIEANFEMLLPQDPPTAAAPDISNESRRAGDLSGAVCFEPWLSLTVNTDGRVSPCCLYWDAGADTIEGRTLREVWTGAFMQRIRRQLAQGAPLPPCAQCLSLMRARNEGFRERLRLQQMGPYHKAVAFGRKALASIAANGFRRSIARAREWSRIGKQW